MEYTKAGQTTDIPVNTMKMVLVGGKEVLLANVDGAYYAIPNKCTHLGGPLAQGKLEGGIVTCPRHGARFDVRTGKATRLPAVVPAPSYPVRITDGRIEIGVRKA